MQAREPLFWIKISDSSFEMRKKNGMKNNEKKIKIFIHFPYLKVLMERMESSFSHLKV